MHLYICSLILISHPYFILNYNIDINSPYFKTILNADKSKLFGFTVDYYNNKLTKAQHFLVGAPKESMPKAIDVMSGALYSCSVTKLENDCKIIEIPEPKERSQLGYSILTSSIDESIYTCAPGYIQDYYNVKYIAGRCWEIDSNFNIKSTIRDYQCEKRLKEFEQKKEMINCFTGATLSSLGAKKILINSPYAFEGRGELIRASFFKTYGLWKSDQHLSLDKYFGTYQLMGSSTSSGLLLRESDTSLTIVLGGPSFAQTNMTEKNVGLGMVAIIRMKTTEVLEYVGLLMGGNFGSGFGYSVLLIDLDSDGYDDLVVGAPYDLDNKGSVYIYWSSSSGSSSSSSSFVITIMKDYNIPLLVDKPLRLQPTPKNIPPGGQFGVSLQRIGDINNDGIQDMAIGAPFENDGIGSVYIYLGNRNRNITVSQKLEGKNINPPIPKGFGFSIYGGEVDLDSNKYPDIIVGASLSNQVYGLMTRPLVRVYWENMLPKSEYKIPYEIEKVIKCQQTLDPCLEIKVSLFFEYVKDEVCQSNQNPLKLNYELELDREYKKETGLIRALFEDNSNKIKSSIDIYCKKMKDTVDSRMKFNTHKILFKGIKFFNVSTPIIIKLNFDVPAHDVPKRAPGGDMVNYFDYPIAMQQPMTFTNKILFGEGCSQTTCKPILDLQVTSSLKKEDNEYILYIRDQATFQLNIKLTNQAIDPVNKALFTYTNLLYNDKHIDLVNITPQVSSTKYPKMSGQILAMKNPLEAKESQELVLQFQLLKEFLQSGNRYIYINISLTGMTPQSHLKPFIMKIRMKMVANIDLKVSLNPGDTPFRKAQIMGFDGIKSEEKIGPKIQMEITLSNKEPVSVIISSKLVIFFPWEISGNISEPNGQFMLYLLRNPHFRISGSKNSIVCDDSALKKLVNVINTRIHKSTLDEKYKPVILKPVPLPNKIPKFDNLVEGLKFVREKKKPKSDWEKTVLISCRNGTARCVPIVCDIGPLSKQSGQISIKFDFRLWLYTFIENYLNYKSVFVEFPIMWIPDVNYDIVQTSSKGDYEDTRIVALNFQKPKPPPSNTVLISIIVSVIVGAALLGIIILVLYRCRFFQRQTIRKRQQLKT